jgi:hypothetical protein
MRPIYLLLKVSLSYSLRLFYRRYKTINEHKERFGSTIYVSNHPNSFMDPLVIGLRNKPVVNFMTRSDVFKWWLKPVLWAAHMLPIYRQHDGEDTKAKNNDAFKSVNRALKRKSNILIFGEGFTDDIPIRSLKPVKKGAIRMGFQAVEDLNWETKIYIAALGVNYTDRNEIGSEVVLVNGDKICLNDFKEEYLAHKSKVINELTKRVEREMQESVIYVKDKHWFSLHEGIMKITRKGFNNESHDDEIPLETRFRYGQKLARWVNEHPAGDTELESLKKDLDTYFGLLKRMKIEDKYVLQAQKKEKIDPRNEMAWLLMMWPLALFGFIHAYIPYKLAKVLTEKMFKRKVFWGSVKMMLGKFFGTLFVIPVVCVVTHYFLPFWWLGIIYFLIIPEFWRLSYEYGRIFKQWQITRKTAKADLSKFVEKRTALEAQISKVCPVA